MTFGESFGAVRAGKENYWVNLLHGALYGASIAQLSKRVTIIGPILRWAPALSQKAADAVKDTERHGALTLEKTRARVKMGNRKGMEDFLAPAIGVLSERQLVDQAFMSVSPQHPPTHPPTTQADATNHTPARPQFPNSRRRNHRHSASRGRALPHAARQRPQPRAAASRGAHSLGGRRRGRRDGRRRRAAAVPQRGA